jgi:hypothetical protein
MSISSDDREILRRLAAEVAEIAQLPVHREKAELWRRLNDLEPVRPLVWINEICWHEMNVDDGLTLRCSDEWCRSQEQGLRRLLYQWRHLPGDMIVSDYLACPLAVRSTGFGVGFREDTLATDPTSDVLSHRYHPQITGRGDLEKIRAPEVTHDEAATQENYERMCRLYEGIMPVRKVGRMAVGLWPWDILARWFGITESLTVLIDRPQLAHATMERITVAYLAQLDRMEELNLLDRNDDNTRVGSGGYGYTSELPAEDHEPGHVRPRDMWGSTADQLFGAVSPEMHWEFGVQYELRWLERCGLTYYGCCEPLHDRIHVLERIPNLRKMSVSPRADKRRAAEEIEDRYVYSLKPNPATLAETRWRPQTARQELRRSLEAARGCRVEIIMKDISTVRYEPQRLWEWQRIAMEEAQEHAP